MAKITRILVAVYMFVAESKKRPNTNPCRRYRRKVWIA
jgi:hypothetical protein